MTQESAQQNNFEGWAIVEIFGHQRYAGFVSTQYFGTCAMFRVDVPELQQREVVTKRPQYIESAYRPAGTTIVQAPVQGYTKFFGVGAIYALTPCTQEAALKTLEAAAGESTPQVTLCPCGSGEQEDCCEECGGPEADEDCPEGLEVV